MTTKPGCFLWAWGSAGDEKVLEPRHVRRAQYTVTALCVCACALLGVAFASASGSEMCVVLLPEAWGYGQM